MGNHDLVRPLVVTVESDEGLVIMNSPSVRVWGSGADVYEAYADFVATFFEVLNSYRDTAETELSPEAIQYRQQLDSYLR
jgi:hypothetical protein